MFKNILNSWNTERVSHHQYELSFYKEDDKWYADVPDVSKEDNEMVFGADTFLEMIAGGNGKCTIIFTPYKIPDYLYHYKIKEHDFDGAYYTSDEGDEIWICNVTHKVCGEHPEDIYIKAIKN